MVNTMQETKEFENCVAIQTADLVHHGWIGRENNHLIPLQVSNVKIKQRIAMASSRLTRQGKKLQAFGTYVNIFRATPTSFLVK